MRPSRILTGLAVAAVLASPPRATASPAPTRATPAGPAGVATDDDRAPPAAEDQDRSADAAPPGLAAAPITVSREPPALGDDPVAYPAWLRRSADELADLRVRYLARAHRPAPTTDAPPPTARAPRPHDLALLAGVLAPRGAITEQRACGWRRIWVSCAHLVVGTQRPPDPMASSTVADLYLTMGVIVRRRRWDLRVTGGLSIINGVVYVSALAVAPVVGSLPPKETASLFPTEAVGNAAFGATLVGGHGLALRAEVAASVHVRVADETRFHLPLPRGVGVVAGLGLEFAR